MTKIELCDWLPRGVHNTTWTSRVFAPKKAEERYLKLYLDESEHSDSEFCYPDKNIKSTSTLVFKPNTDKNASDSGYNVSNIVDSD